MVDKLVVHQRMYTFCHIAKLSSAESTMTINGP